MGSLLMWSWGNGVPGGGPYNSTIEDARECGNAICSHAAVHGRVSMVSIASTLCVI